MRVSEQNRQDAKNDPDFARLLVDGGPQCDHCDQEAELFVIDGVTARFFCPDGYLVHVRESRASRPSRDELAGAVSRAVARAGV